MIKLMRRAFLQSAGLLGVASFGSVEAACESQSRGDAFTSAEFVGFTCEHDGNEWSIEVRFSDGSKFQFVQQELPRLAKLESRFGQINPWKCLWSKDGGLAVLQPIDQPSLVREIFEGATFEYNGACK